MVGSYAKKAYSAGAGKAVYDSHFVSYSFLGTGQNRKIHFCLKSYSYQIAVVFLLYTYDI